MNSLLVRLIDIKVLVWSHTSLWSYAFPLNWLSPPSPCPTLLLPHLVLSSGPGLRSSGAGDLELQAEQGVSVHISVFWPEISALKVKYTDNYCYYILYSSSSLRQTNGSVVYSIKSEGKKKKKARLNTLLTKLRSKCEVLIKYESMLCSCIVYSLHQIFSESYFSV